MHPRHYMIQIDSPEAELTMEEAEKLLAETGIELDRNYGPILIDPLHGRYIMRGTATLEAREAAERIEGVQLFGDARIGPM